MKYPVRATPHSDIHTYSHDVGIRLFNYFYYFFRPIFPILGPSLLSANGWDYYRSEGLPERDISSLGVMGRGLEVATNSSAVANVYLFLNSYLL